MIKIWFDSTKRLSQIEREHFGWDHAQAGAWIVQSWGFPDEMVCYLGAHTLSLPDIDKFELKDTLAIPLSIAAHCASVLRPDHTRAERIRQLAFNELGFSEADLKAQLQDIKSSVNELIDIFELSNRGVDQSLDQLMGQADALNNEAVA